MLLSDEPMLPLGQSECDGSERKMEHALDARLSQCLHGGHLSWAFLAGVTKLSVMPGPTQKNDPSHLGLSPAAGSRSGRCWRPIGFVDTGRCYRGDAGDVEWAQLLAGGLRRQGVGKVFAGVAPALFDVGAPMFSGPRTMAPPRSGAVGFSRA